MIEKAKSKKLPGRVFYVTAPIDPTVLIALDIMIDGEVVRWFDSVKERIMTAKQITDYDPSHFVFERDPKEGGGTYTFIPMTLEIYQEKVKNHILIPRDFTAEEEMLKAFEQTRDNEW